MNKICVLIAVVFSVHAQAEVLNCTFESVRGDFHSFVPPETGDVVQVNLAETKIEKLTYSGNHRGTAISFDLRINGPLELDRTLPEQNGKLWVFDSNGLRDSLHVHASHKSAIIYQQEPENGQTITTSWASLSCN